IGWQHAKRIVASAREGGRGERQGAADSRPDESTPALAEQVAGPSVTMHHCRTIQTQNTIQPPQSFIQHKQLAAAQGWSLSPLTKKGSISLYSRIFTVASLGTLPRAIARNAFSDCATIARARSFLWIEWYLDGMAQCSSGIT